MLDNKPYVYYPQTASTLPVAMVSDGLLTIHKISNSGFYVKLKSVVDQNSRPYFFFIKIQLFNPFQNKPWFLRVCSTSLLKTMREKEKLLVTSNFSFTHSVFDPFKKKFRHSHSS